MYGIFRGALPHLSTRLTQTRLGESTPLIPPLEMLLLPPASSKTITGWLLSSHFQFQNPARQLLFRCCRCCCADAGDDPVTPDSFSKTRSFPPTLAERLSNSRRCVP